MARDVIKEYAIQISVQGSKAVIKEFKELGQVEKKQNKELKETNSLLWTYAKRLVGIYAIYKMFKKGIDLSVSFAQQGNALKNMTTVANISAQSLQKWGYAIRKFGGDEKSVATAMGNINQKLYQRRYGQEPFKEYIEKYGALPAGQNAEDFLINIAKKMEGYANKQTKLDIASTLGLDDAITAFLMQGSKAVESQLKQAQALFSEEDIENARKATEQMIAFNRELEKLKIALARDILPKFTEFVAELTEFVKNPKKYMANAFTDKPTSAYGVAKSMFNPFTTGNWVKERLLGLSNFSATTGLDFVGSSYRALKDNVSGGDIEVNNNITMNITGQNADEIAEKSGNAITGITGQDISNEAQRQGDNRR